MSHVPHIDFYTRVVESWHGADVDNHRGNRPRGTFTEGQPGEVRLLAVLLNPGQPRKTEMDRQGDARSARLAEILWDFSGEVLNGGHHSRTLSILRKDVSFLLGMPFAECGRTFMFTNLVRCTTAGNRQPSQPTIAIGARWLREEIALWRPEKVVAYGNVVRDGMQAHDLRFDAVLPHPAALGEWTKAGRRQEKLEEVRRQLGFAT